MIMASIVKLKIVSNLLYSLIRKKRTYLEKKYWHKLTLLCDSFL